MISLRKHIDNYVGRAAEPGSRDSSAQVLLAEFRGTLLAIGESADRAVPGFGVEIKREMTALSQPLAQSVSADLLTQTGKQTRMELAQWADRVLAHHQLIERELREIVSGISATADSVSGRDARYALEIRDLTGRLRRIATENDLPQMRRSILENARFLTGCIARMEVESKASLDQLQAQVQDYRSRFEEAERVSQTDPLTRLANRRGFEQHLEDRVAAGKPFCLILMDLNDFKNVNDLYGHVAGDDLLKQFAVELKAQFNVLEVVARWGGDEFAAVIGGSLNAALDKAERIRTWTFGEYKITQRDLHVKVQLQAAIGVAEWDCRETGLNLLARADQEVYKAKATG